MNPTGSRIWRFIDRYRMIGILLILCVACSLATVATQQPRGADAAKSVARQLGGLARESNVAILAPQNDEGREFADALDVALRKAGLRVCAKVVGGPRDAKIALRALNASATPVGAIAATPQCSSWTFLSDPASAFPAIGHPRTVYPISYRWPNFLKLDNLLNVINQITVIAIIAVGMTLVILTGGIDLSVGSLVALAAVVTAMLIRDHGGERATAWVMVWASAAGIAVCGLIGLFSGALVTYLRLPSFIATLGIMQIARGWAEQLSSNQSINQIPASFTWLGLGTVFSIPRAVALMAIAFAVAHVVMTRTTFGRYVYAVGGNAEAARLSGVRVSRILLWVYTLSGISAGIGGVVLASQLKSGASTYGMMYELEVIAAVVVGGASLAGGEGRIMGTLIGALIIGVIQNGMNLVGIRSAQQKVALGFVIIIAVGLDMMRRRTR
jgi:ribose transport system permease protein